MELIRGRAPSAERDRAATADALERAGSEGEVCVRVRPPHRQVAFGRRDARSNGYERAVAAATDRGFDPVERSVGGRAVAYTGETLAFAVAVPLADSRSGITDRYDTATETVVDALRGLGGDVEPGEPPASFCPGDHSVRMVDGGKVAGVAQRVRADAALVSGCVVVCRADEAPIAGVLEPVYDALDVPFGPASVGSVASAGGPDSPTRVVSALETALADAWDDGSERRVRTLGERSHSG